LKFMLNVLSTMNRTSAAFGHGPTMFDVLNGSVVFMMLSDVVVVGVDNELG
jgi:hypothetical protein